MRSDVELAAEAYRAEHQMHVDAHRLLLRVVNGISEMGDMIDPSRLAKLIEPARKFVGEHCHLCGGKKKVSMNGHGVVRCPECRIVGI